MAARFTELIVDASDPPALAAWWAEVLGWESTGTYKSAVEIADPTGALPTIVFVPVPEPKSVKNRVHIDVSPRDCDQATELERLLALGARPVDVGQDDVPWHVLADPEGNEFCLLRTQVD